MEPTHILLTHCSDFLTSLHLPLLIASRSALRIGLADSLVDSHHLVLYFDLEPRKSLSRRGRVGRGIKFKSVRIGRDEEVLREGEEGEGMLILPGKEELREALRERRRRGKSVSGSSTSSSSSYSRSNDVLPPSPTSTTSTSSSDPPPRPQILLHAIFFLPPFTAYPPFLTLTKSHIFPISLFSSFYPLSKRSPNLNWSNELMENIEFERHRTRHPRTYSTSTTSTTTSSSTTSSSSSSSKEAIEFDLEILSEYIIQDIELGEGEVMIKRIKKRVRRILLARKLLGIMGISGLEIVVVT